MHIIIISTAKRTYQVIFKTINSFYKKLIFDFFKNFSQNNHLVISNFIEITELFRESGRTD